MLTAFLVLIQYRRLKAGSKGDGDDFLVTLIALVSIGATLGIAIVSQKQLVSVIESFQSKAYEDRNKEQHDEEKQEEKKIISSVHALRLRSDELRHVFVKEKDRNEVLAALRSCKGSRITIWGLENEKRKAECASELADVFEAAGWNVSLEPAISRVPVSGIIVRSKNEHSPACLEAVRNALGKAGLKMHYLADASLDDDEVVLIAKDR